MTATTAPAPAVPRVSGWLGRATSTDHKRIGLNLAICSLIFFLAWTLVTSGWLAFRVGTERATPAT